jgi:arsenate reductase
MKDGLNNKNKIRILFLCTGNSCRSQMAEGWVRFLKHDVIDAYSAGIESHGINPYAVKIMAEAGIDISTQRSKNIDEFENVEFDYIITLCDHAKETCPMVPVNTKKIHVSFEDPAIYAYKLTVEDEILYHFRKVRDEIKTFVEEMPEVLKMGKYENM